jgi:hypothetical protein
VFAKDVGLIAISQLSVLKTLTYVGVVEAKLSTWSDTTKRIIAWLGEVTLMRTTTQYIMGSCIYPENAPAITRIA